MHHTGDPAWRSSEPPASPTSPGFAISRWHRRQGPIPETPTAVRSAEPCELRYLILGQRCLPGRGCALDDPHYVLGFIFSPSHHRRGRWCWCRCQQSLSSSAGTACASSSSLDDGELWDPPDNWGAAGIRCVGSLGHPPR